MKRLMIITAAVAAILLIGITASGCTSNKSTNSTSGGVSGTVRVGGSTTVLPIAQAAAEQFQAKNPNARVEVQGTGSSEGITGVSNGTLDIGDSSRELTVDEQKLGLVDHKIAIDVVVFIVNPSNKLSNLSKQQVIDILTGKITNFKEVGGPDETIQVVGRDTASGTREYVQKEVIGSNNTFVSNALALPGNGQVKAAVAQTPTAFGYMSFGQVDTTVKMVKIDGVTPSEQAVRDNKYPYQRFLHMFTKGEAKGAAKAFIDFVLSKDFQNGTVSKEFLTVSK